MADKADTADSHQGGAPTAHRWIWFVTGPTACGKTTVAKQLAEELKMTYLEGDDFHPKSNVDKMSRGEPLVDSDRWDWLRALRDRELVKPPGKPTDNLVVTCSALKRHYRDVLREGSTDEPGLRIRFVYLEAPESVLVRRAAARKGHFAGSNLVHSQFMDLEPPEEDEDDVVRIDVDRSPDEVQKDVVSRIGEIMGRDNP